MTSATSATPRGDGSAAGLGDVDWAATPLGPRRAWPPLLASMVELVSASRLPMFLLWGEGQAFVYNDAYRPILGARHPRAFGRPFAEAWPEAWGELGMIVERAFGGESSLFQDFPIVLERHDGPAPAWFNISCSPVADEADRIRGVLCIGNETTAAVLAARRQKFWFDLEADLRELHEAGEIIGAAQAALGRYLGVSRAGYGDVDETGRYFRTDATWTDGSVAPHDGVRDLAAYGPEVLAALQAGEMLVVEDVRTDPRTNSPDILAAFAAVETRSAVVVTLVREGRLRAAAYVHSRLPRRWREEELKLIQAVAARIWSAVERARAETALRESEARFRAMADTAPAPVWVTGAAGGMEFVNSAFAELSGRPREAMLGDGWIDLLHPEDLPVFAETRARARETQSPYTVEGRFRTAGGEWRMLHTSSRPRFDEAGRFAGYVGLAMDVTEMRAGETRQRLLINELNHRVKNTLTTVQSLIHQTLRAGMSATEARQALTNRLMALSAAHNVLTQAHWEGAEVCEIIAEALRPFDAREDQIEVTCTEGRLRPSTALAFAMVLHELATNAVKYGALSCDTGRVKLDCAMGPDTIELTWIETGGPPVTRPTRTGFGLRLLERGLAAEFGSAAAVDFRPEGVVCTLKARRQT